MFGLLLLSIVLVSIMVLLLGSAGCAVGEEPPSERRMGLIVSVEWNPAELDLAGIVFTLDVAAAGRTQSATYVSRRPADFTRTTVTAVGAGHRGRWSEGRVSLEILVAFAGTWTVTFAPVLLVPPSPVERTPPPFTFGEVLRFSPVFNRAPAVIRFTIAEQGNLVTPFTG